MHLKGDSMKDSEVAGLLYSNPAYHQMAATGNFDSLELEVMKDLHRRFQIVRGKVLDVGTGSGTLIKEFLPEVLADGMTCFDGFDLSPQGLGELQELAEATNTQTGRVVIDKIWQASFYEPIQGLYDTAIANFALNCGEDLGRALTTIAAAIKPGGYFLVSSVFVENARDRGQLWAELGEQGNSVRVFAYKRSWQETLSSLEQAGFELLTTEARFQPTYYRPYLQEGEQAYTFVVACQKRI
jgi:SAM-dependent methyltransferase